MVCENLLRVWEYPYTFSARRAVGCVCDNRKKNQWFLLSLIPRCCSNKAYNLDFLEPELIAPAHKYQLLKRLKQGDHKFKACLPKSVKPCLKIKKKKKGCDVTWVVFV